MFPKSTYQTASQVFDTYLVYMRNGASLPFSNTQAMFNQSFVITAPEEVIIKHHERKWSLAYAQREWEWYESGDRSVSKMKKFAPIWDKMHGGDEKVWSNYGWWWKLNDQFDKMVRLLLEDRSTRRAILVHYDPQLIDSFVHDTPCNVVLNFWIYAGQLQLTIFARSIDLWYGFCNDQFCFSMLMQKVAKLTDTKVGEMHWFITNFHLYNDKLK